MFNCLRKIMNIRWPEKISNINLWQRTNQHPIDTDILQRRWRWLGHTLKKPQNSITRTALTWNPQGKRRKGRPRNTWRRDLNMNMADMGMGWPKLVTVTQDRRNWRLFVNGLTFRRRHGPWWWWLFMYGRRRSLDGSARSYDPRFVFAIASQ